MRFSIIVPVYNAEKDLLLQCVQSVEKQTFTDWELLLCEDGSTDGVTPALCDKIAARAPEKIRVIHQPNGGPGAARNIGIEAAQGEYLCFLDSDDHLSPEALAILNRRVDECGADLIELGFCLEQDGQITKHFSPVAPTDRVVSLAEMPEILFAPTGAPLRLVRRAFLLQTGFRFPARVLIAEDLRLTLRLLPMAERITAVPDELYYYVERPGSIMRLGEIERNRQVLEAFQDVCGWYQAQGLWDQYRSELGMLCLEHLLLSTSVRVLRADTKSPLLSEIQLYMDQQFPDYMDNPYLSRLTKPKKLALRLIRSHQYGAVKALFSIKDRLF